MTKPFPISRAAAALAVGALALGLAPCMAASPSELLYERALMSRAGDRCRLFTPDIAAALAAGEAQARGAALRGGASNQETREVVARAASKADALPCRSIDLSIAAGRVKKAFNGYAQLRVMSFPGSFAPWQADRQPWSAVVDGKVVPGPRWRLWQSGRVGRDPMVFGLTSRSDLVALRIAAAPAALESARLIIRDPIRAPEPFLDLRRADLSARIPQRSVTQTFLAQSVGDAPLSLLPSGARGGVVAVFPPAAALALAALDPREGATVEFVYPSREGERVESAMVEVGDFAAGRAFLAAGR